MHQGLEGCGRPQSGIFRAIELFCLVLGGWLHTLCFAKTYRLDFNKNTVMFVNV